MDMKSLLSGKAILKSLPFCLILLLAACSGPITINTAEDFGNIRNELRGKYKLVADITLNNWQPIEGFNGILDGNGHTITINSIPNALSSTDGVIKIGLFSTIEKEGIIKNLRINGDISSPITSKECWAGALAAYNQGLIENCASQAIVTSSGGTAVNVAGGITAENNEGIITNCYSIGDITAIGENESMVSSGGITGINRGLISVSFAAGMVLSKAEQGTSIGGGLTGNNESGSIENSVALNTVVRVLGGGSNHYGRIIDINNAVSTNNYAFKGIKLFGQGFAKIKEDNLIDISLLQDPNWWNENTKFSFGTTITTPWKWSIGSNMPILYDWQEKDFVVGMIKSAGAYGLTFFDEPQIYTAIIPYDKSKNVEVSFTLSPDVTQITELKFSADELYLTPKNWTKKTNTDKSKESIFKYSERTTASTNFAIQSVQGYNTVATDASGNLIIDNIVLKGGLENTAPLEVINEKVYSDMGMIFDLSVTDACIYGEIKFEMNGCGTPAVYTVMKNITTPQEIPSEIMDPQK